MDTRVALIGIMIENTEAANAINQLLHEHAKYIIGRMGLPYREKHLNIISVVVDAPMDIISTISGKIGRLEGVSTKTAYAPLKNKEEIHD